MQTLATAPLSNEQMANYFEFPPATIRRLNSIAQSIVFQIRRGTIDDPDDELRRAALTIWEWSREQLLDKHESMGGNDVRG